MPLPDYRQLPWPAAAASLDGPARLRHLVAGALRTGRPLAVWREPGAAQPQLLAARSLEETYTGLPPALDDRAPAGFAFFPFRDSDHNPALFLPADVLYDPTRPEIVAVAPAARWRSRAVASRRAAASGHINCRRSGACIKPFLQ